MRQRLAEAQSVCVTVDMWTNRQMRSYRGMTGHFVEDWTLKSSVLSCTRFNGRHTADNIYTHYDEVIRIFDIQKKVSHIISDSAANILKAFSLPGFQPVLFNDISDESDADSSESEADDHDDSVIDSTENDNNPFQFLPEHDPCFTHILQLVDKDGLKEAGPLRKIITKASNIVSHIKKSTHAADLLEGDKKVQTVTPTRFGGQDDSICAKLAF